MRGWIEPVRCGKKAVPQQCQHPHAVRPDDCSPLADLTAEHEMLTLLSEGVTHCAQVADYTTRHMLESMLQDVDEHIDWIETQQELIRQVGLEQYLSEQIKKEAS